ncbi:MAG: hypothetical protein P8078_11385, partial [bacterium]
MRLLKVLNRLVLLCCLLLISNESKAQVNLLNIQKGADGKKAWIILTFDKNVTMLGVSQQKYNVLNLYLKCLTGKFENSTITIADALDREIRVKQINTTPMIAKFDIVCKEEVPLSIIRKDKYIVISMESDKLVTANKSVSSPDMFEYSGRIVDVNNEVLGDKSVTTLKLEGNYEWIGYYRRSIEKCELLISNAILLTSEDEYLFSNSPLREVQLTVDNEDIDKTFIHLTFQPLHAYSIFDVKSEITVRTDRDQSINPEMVEEKEEEPKDDLVKVDYIDTDEVTLESLFMTDQESKEAKEDTQDKTKIAYQDQIREEKKEEPVKVPEKKPESQP